MPTQPFSDTVKRRLQEDPEFKGSLLAEVGELFLNGDVETAKGMLATFIKATCGYEDLARELDRPSSSIKRMLSEKGNPSITNLSAMLSSLSGNAGVTYHVEATTPKAG